MTRATLFEAVFVYRTFRFGTSATWLHLYTPVTPKKTLGISSCFILFLRKSFALRRCFGRAKKSDQSVLRIVNLVWTLHRSRHRPKIPVDDRTQSSGKHTPANQWSRSVWRRARSCHYLATMDKHNFKVGNDLELPPLRTLDDFLLESARFQLPNLKDFEKWGKRVVNNLLYYQTNYMFMSIVIFLIVGWVDSTRPTRADLFLSRSMNDTLHNIFFLLAHVSAAILQFSWLESSSFVSIENFDCLHDKTDGII